MIDAALSLFRAGHLPAPDADGRRYLKTPLDRLGKPADVYAEHKCAANVAANDSMWHEKTETDHAVHSYDDA